MRVVADVQDVGLVFHCITCRATLDIDDDDYSKLTHPKRDCPFTKKVFNHPFVMELTERAGE